MSNFSSFSRGISDNSLLLVVVSSTNLVRYGLLKGDEAEQLTAEIEEHINDTLLCDKVVHPGELSFADEDQNTKIELTNGASAN